jgi:hypothetical protein
MAFAISGDGTTLTIGSGINLCWVTLAALGASVETLDATCLSNSTWTTKKPSLLKDVPDLSFTAKFDPAELAGIRGEVGVNQLLVLTYPDASTDTFWGYLQDFTPDAGAVSTVWEMSGTIVVSNMNGSDVETGPVNA